MYQYEQAFTLIELLVVVLIIGILVAIAVPQYQISVSKARAVQIVTVTKNLVEAQQRYFVSNGYYATNISELDIDFAETTEEDQITKSFAITKNSRCTFENLYLYCTMAHPNIVIQRHYNSERLDCCSYPSDSYKGDILCQQITADKTWSNGCGKSGCHCYHR